MRERYTKRSEKQKRIFQLVFISIFACSSSSVWWRVCCVSVRPSHQCYPSRFGACEHAHTQTQQYHTILFYSCVFWRRLRKWNIVHTESSAAAAQRTMAWHKIAVRIQTQKYRMCIHTHARTTHEHRTNTSTHACTHTYSVQKEAHKRYTNYCGAENTQREQARKMSKVRAIEWA